MAEPMTSPTADGQGWRPIETAPKGEWLLIDRGRGGIIEACFTSDEDGQVGWIDSYGNLIYDAENWISLDALPSPPTSGDTP